MDYSIRQFIYPQDYDQVIQLWKNSGEGIRVSRSDTREEIAKKLERDPDLFLVAVNSSDQIIGTVLGGFDGRRGIMYHLAVEEGSRNQGIASALIDTLENHLRSKGCIRCHLMVKVENLTAIDYYEKHGWKRIPVWAYGKDLSG